jgi:hypothetical protein
MAPAHGAGERGFAALPRAQQTDHRGIRERGAQGRFQRTRPELGVHLPVR